MDIASDKYMGHIQTFVGNGMNESIEVTTTGDYTSDRPPTMILFFPNTGFSSWASTPSGIYGQYIQVKLPEPVYITHYSFRSHSSGVYNINWNFSASLDGSYWKLLDEHINDTILSSGNEELFSLSKSGVFQFFRLTNNGPTYYPGAVNGQKILYVRRFELFHIISACSCFFLCPLSTLFSLHMIILLSTLS